MFEIQEFWLYQANPEIPEREGEGSPLYSAVPAKICVLGFSMQITMYVYPGLRTDALSCGYGNFLTKVIFG